MSEMENLINKYFRPGRLPHIWCPGCGNGVITGAIVKAIDKQGLAKDDVAVISGIGWLLQPFLRLSGLQHRQHSARPCSADCYRCKNG